MHQSLYAQLGGESKLRAIIDEFVERLCDDLLIGFFFYKTKRARLKELEYAHAAAFLGAEVAYAGRPLAQVHKPLRIAGGQFSRRLQILREVLAAHAVPAAVNDAWLAHQQLLRPHIVADPQSVGTG
jgi:truncated hemoglobin YjbI